MAERKRLTKTERQAVYGKMEGHCAYCGSEISLQTMQVDHIVPLRKGGADTMDNMRPACRSCNHYKHTLTIEQFRAEIGRLTARLRERSYIYRLALRHGRIREATKPVRFYFEKEAER